ncbi:MAG TPA: metalloregulator ArsR/SmtB family transcription factor [Polyangiales bacterium]|jgi:DNA-binding transcriptional ArsR family regulator
MSRRSVDAGDAKLDAVFAALADPTRRRIVAQLARGSATISELAEPFSMTLPAVSKHLRVLERAGLLRREREGWYHHCSLDARPLDDAVAFITRYRSFWEDTLEQLARHVERAPDEKSRKK